MTPKHRKIMRDAWQAIGQKGSASNANPFSKSGPVAGAMQEWIANNHPVEAAEMRLENNPDGLCLDAQCVLDGSLHPDAVSEEVMQNLFDFNPKFTRHLVNQEKAAFDERVAAGNASLADMVQLEEAGDPRAAELREKAEALKAKTHADQAGINASLAMQSREQASQQMKAEAFAAGRLF